MPITSPEYVDVTRLRLPAAAAIVAAILVALAEPGGELLPCVADGRCDGDAVGAGAIAQPVAAWSSLGLAAVAIWLTGRSEPGDRVIGWALALSSIGAFWYHASLTVWAGRVDAAGVAAVATAFLVREAGGGDRLPTTVAAGTAIVAAAAATGTAAVAAAIAGTIAGVFVLGRARDRDLRLLAGAMTVFVVGGAFWRFGPHGVWHLAAAAAIAMLAGHVGSGPTARPPLRFEPGST